MHLHYLVVGLEAGGGHAPPYELAAVGAPHGVHVVAEVVFGEVGGFVVGEVVDEDVGVGADGEVLAGGAFAAIGDLLSVRAPHSVLHASEGRYRTVETLAFQQLDGFVGRIVGGDEQVGVCAVCPAVPVAVHQVVVNHRVGFGQVRVTVDDGGVELNVAGV